LWIDSLCIVQDDPDDWQRESAQMASIFGSSYLTISASHGRDAEVGCFSLRPTSIEYNYRKDNGEEFSVFVRKLSEHRALHTPNLFSKGLPDVGKAWCFQERLLSKCVVHFTKSEMLWDCTSICHCECGALDNDRNSLMGTYNKVLDSLNFVQETQKYTLSSFQESQELEITLKKKVWELWTNILKHYRTRKLTYESDFLPALSGLATRLQQAGMELTSPVCGETISPTSWHGAPQLLRQAFPDIGL
jgi:hypothetical protein